MRRYDFQAAQNHRTQMVTYYRRMKRHFDDDGTWSWWLKAQIEELDQEMMEAHRVIIGEMTAVGSSGHSVIQIGNVITPIVPHWRKKDQGAILL